jgi:hypothetical protein
MSATTSPERTRLWTALRSQFRATRDALTARQTLERELASYTSESDLDDLYAMLDRYSDRDTAQIRRILAARQG